MSKQAREWAWAQELPMTQKFVLVALAEFADNRGECFPSHKTLAARIGGSVETVRRALSALKKGGYVETLERYAEGGRRTSNIYRLNLPPTTESSSTPYYRK